DGCMASLNVRWKKHRKWVVTRFEEEHNHILDTPRRPKKHHSHNVSHKNSAAKDLMEQLQSCGIGPSTIAKTINMNSSPKLITRFPFEKIVADRYTAVMFKLSKAELHESVSCWYEMVSHHDVATTYVVGLCDEDKRRWWTVVYDEAQGATLKCECAKFETGGYFCKHLLRIMQGRHLTVIPGQYMLNRWTIGDRYIMESGVFTCNENENMVTPIIGKRRWWTVVYDEAQGATLKCECAKF
ncbi:FAR1 domain-containing protein/SWIM domain-containing protein, partial [Cephalotus follicularis]